MKKIDEFTNLYPMAKTIRFRLIPIGMTEHNFDAKQLLAEDEHRAQSYSNVKKYLDRYYKAFIDDALPDVRLQGLREYAALYYRANKTDAEKKEMSKSEESFRKQIVDVFEHHPEYKTLFKKEAIQKLPDFLKDEQEKECVQEFSKFATYFTGFFKNRENIFTSEEKVTGIAYRCINDNLPRFLDNVRSFQRIKAAIPEEVERIDSLFGELFSVTADELFCVDGFTYVLCQADIDKYNQVIGGYSRSDKEKIPGLNEIINLYNQQVGSKKDRLPKLKPLYKQILSERSTVSFIPEAFEDDNAVIGAIARYFEQSSVCGHAEDLKNIFCRLCEYDLDGIYVKNDLSLTEMSKSVFGSWDAVRRAWEGEYDRLKGYKDDEKYLEKRSKAYKTNKSFSLVRMDHLGSQCIAEDIEKKSVGEWAAEKATALANAVLESYCREKDFLASEYRDEKDLRANDERVAEIKVLLDSVKSLESFAALFLGTGREENKDDVFYGEFLPHYDTIAEIDGLYDRVRNYVTQKPYSNDKIKLNFRNPQFLGGWDRSKESDYSAVLLRKDKSYYIAVMDDQNKNVFKSTPDVKEEFPYFEKVVYKQIPNNAKYFSSKQILPQNPPEHIVKILAKKKADNKSLSADEIKAFIDYIRYDFLENYSCLRDKNGKKFFNFSLKPTAAYHTLDEFFADLDGQAYTIKYLPVPAQYINELVNSGKIYLFQLYSKDFSSSSHGAPNLHTMYFKALFDPKNLENVVFKLNGGAEMFYRKASIKYSEEVMEKGHHYNELKDKFSYPIIKDRRYTRNQFMLHVPITLNFNAAGTDRINEKVCEALRECEDNYVIGIDRGERNLIYVCVINGRGEIVEQYSLNDIVNEYNGKTHHADYHALLAAKEKDRLDARKNWSAIENIKELKEGYISQVVHKICELVEKYDAVIAMEDLNFGFKNSRGKVEKSVYQKFEKMLIDKLNFYVNKGTDPALPGGLYHAYQLTEKFVSFEKMGKQNGFIFYVPAWLTSKIDPTTGFVDMLYPRYESVDTARSFFAKFKRISYNSDRDYFEFEFDYSDFGMGGIDHRKRWTLCTFGKRIETFAKNSGWDCRIIDLTNSFKELFAKYSIHLTDDMQSEILARSEKGFYKDLTKLLKLTLQMRNSRTGTEEDYLISPVMNQSGVFYCSKDYSGRTAPLPADADANGAYHIAKKALWAIQQIKKQPIEEISKVKLTISKAEWLAFVQKQ